MSTKPNQEPDTHPTQVNLKATSKHSGEWLGQLSSMLSRYIHGTATIADVAAPEAPAPKDAPLTVEVGTMISDRYRVQRLLGRGGMGSVFEVIHDRLGKSFALKLMKETKSANEETQRLFFREARYASRLQHVSLPDVVDFGQDPDYGWFMVVEYVEGENLDAVVKRKKKLSAQHAVKIVMQVAEALKVIHDSGVTHCDIKAENIMIAHEQIGGRRREIAKLIDFGLARSKALRPRLEVSGSPHYISPEVINGWQPSPSADIYALGVLLYYLVSGKLPFKGDLKNVLKGHLTLPPPTIDPPIDPAVEACIKQALSKDPEDRQPTISSLIYELRAIMSMLKGTSGRSPKVTKAESPEPVVRDLPIPVAVLTEMGVVEGASRAFAGLVLSSPSELIGATLTSTPLSKIWMTLQEDLDEALGGSPVRRMLELADVDGETTRVMACIDPMPLTRQACLWIHPVER